MKESEVVGALQICTVSGLSAMNPCLYGVRLQKSFPRTSRKCVCKWKALGKRWNRELCRSRGQAQCQESRHRPRLCPSTEVTFGKVCTHAGVRGLRTSVKAEHPVVRQLTNPTRDRPWKEHERMEMRKTRRVWKEETSV